MALCEVYRSDDVEASFREAADVFGAKYDLAAYPFFLCDDGRFLPVRPRLFEGKLRTLGRDLRLEVEVLPGQLPRASGHHRLPEDAHEVWLRSAR